MGSYIMPASEDFLEGDQDPRAIERNANNIPYPKLEVFAQNLVSVQKWDHLTALVDGMNLSLEWGQEHLRLDSTLSEEDIEHAKAKMEKYAEPLVRLGRTQPGSPGGFRIDGFDKGRRWARIVSRTEQRVRSDSIWKVAGWSTQFRTKGSVDPRLKQDRAV
jgi:hypothetical protein